MLYQKKCWISQETHIFLWLWWFEMLKYILQCSICSRSLYTGLSLNRFLYIMSSTNINEKWEKKGVTMYEKNPALNLYKCIFNKIRYTGICYISFIIFFFRNCKHCWCMWVRLAMQWDRIRKCLWPWYMFMQHRIHPN